MKKSLRFKSAFILLFFLLCGLLVSSPLFAGEDTDVFRLREKVVVPTDETINSAIAVGNSVRVDGRVIEQAVAIGGDVVVDEGGLVEGDAIAVGGRVIQFPGSQIKGKITSLPFSLTRFRKALVVAIPTVALGLSTIVGAAIVLGSVGSLALAFLTLSLLPAQTRGAREQCEGHPVKAFVFGFVSLLLAIPVLIFLVITVIGIPLAFVLSAVLMAALVLGTVSIGQWVGMRVAAYLKRRIHPVLAGMVGLLLLSAAAAVPFLGVIFQPILVCLALGSVALSRFRPADQ